MPDTAPSRYNVVPAATIVVFRHGLPGTAPELLMLERTKKMRFAAGAAVFPGGRIDPADRELAARLEPGAKDPDDAAARVAALRETLEEAGLALGIRQAVTAEEAAAARALLLERGALAAVLERHRWTLDLDVLVPFARWCPDWDGAFDTRFYLTDLRTGAVELAADATENTRLFWASATETLAMADRGDVSILFPTRRNLERLEKFDNFAAACAECSAIAPRIITPYREDRDGVVHLAIPGDLGYPVTSQPVDTVRRG